ncbi:MmgE/PrpD family protein [Proteinivorax hydrogeniformans]|uniref:MmgE/PrpD family protein n=1 Tax=Proteinivorax hydrogeniformans TaxID=1826727 RepID=A0AAU8HX00_9FIRM
MMYNLTERFINEMQIFSEVKFSDSTLNQAKRCLLDYLGVTYAGSFALGNKKRSLLLSQFDRGLKEASLIGFNKKVSVEGAAYINGVSGHVLELDDGVRFGGIHPGAPIISALLSLAEKEKISGQNLLKGIITGYETAIRIASAIQPFHHNRGYHPTGTCGTIGATVALAIALNFTNEQLKLAFTNAAVNASGTLKVIEGASEIKALNAGNASLNAVMAIHSARVGFKVPEDVLSGEKGFINMMAGEYDESLLLKENSEPEIEKVYFKLYSACRHCHSPIEAAFKIRKQKRIVPEEIKKIRIKTYRYVINKHDHTDILGTASAKMSIPYSVVIALLFGRAQDSEFSLEKIKDPSVLSTINKVEIIEDKELSKWVPERRPAIIEVTLYNGEKYKQQVDFPKGEPENPLTNQELEEKFKELAIYGGKSEDETYKIINCVLNLQNSLDDLLKYF